MIVIYIIILVLAIPTGQLLAKLCKDELKDWKFRFKIIFSISATGAILLYFSQLEYKIPMIVALLFIIINLSVLVKKAP